MAFEYRHFNAGFINRLKQEIPYVVAEAKADNNLDNFKPSKRYKTRLQRRIKRLGLDEDNDDDVDWRKDPGEVAERIWLWWKRRSSKFKYFYLALRLVVLAQFSSCNVERVFSKLMLITNTCGHNMLEDMFETRMLFQCNGDLNDFASLYEDS